MNLRDAKRMVYEQELNYEREKNTKPDDYKYYNPKNFTTNPERIYKIIDEIEKTKDLDKRREDFVMDRKKGEPVVPLVRANFTVGHATYDWKSPDDAVVKAEARERTLNGRNIDMAIKTLKNFDSRDIDGKIAVMQRFDNSTESMELFTDLKYGKFNERNRDLKKFLENYEILEDPYIDLKTGMSALVIGNRRTKNVEIIFGASQDPSHMFDKDRPKELKDFEGNEILKEYIQKGENGKYARKDWSNDVVSAVMISGNQEAALEFAKRIKKKYKTEHNGYQTLTDVNGHSKGGGEAMHSASHLDLRCLTIDPAPDTDPGKFINNYKFMSIVPGNGNAILTTVEKIEGTEFHTLKFKVGTHGKGAYKTSNTLAIPVEYNTKREELIKERYGNSFALNFVQHYSDNEKTIERIEELQKYAKEIEPRFNEVYKDGKYIDEKTSGKSFAR